MADFSALIQRIKDAVYENGVQAITGQILQDCLKDVVNTVNVAKQDGIYRVTVTVDNNTGVPSATARMDDDTYTLEFSFHNLKGETGPQGPQGDTPVLTADSDGVIYSDGVMLTRVIKDTTDALTTRADSDHARAESDHARAETDHTDITRARGDAETAASEANYASLRANGAADTAIAAAADATEAAGTIDAKIATKQDVIADLPQIREGATDTVKYSTQTLTDAEKEQARTNIGAASDSEVSQLRSEVGELSPETTHIVVGNWVSGTYVTTDNVGRYATDSRRIICDIDLDGKEGNLFSVIMSNGSQVAIRFVSVSQFANPTDIAGIDANEILLATGWTGTADFTIPTGTKSAIVIMKNSGGTTIDTSASSDASFSVTSTPSLSEKVEELSNEITLINTPSTILFDIENWVSGTYVTTDNVGRYATDSRRIIGTVDISGMDGEMLAVAIASGYDASLRFLSIPQFVNPTQIAGVAQEQSLLQTGWIGTSNVTIPSGTRSAIIVLRKHDDSTVDTTIASYSSFSVTLDGLKARVDALEAEVAGARKEITGYYSGERLFLGTKTKIPFLRKDWKTIGIPSYAQSLAIYGDYIVFFYGTANATGSLWSISGGTKICDLSFGYGTFGRPHGNVICFGSEFAEGNTVLPLLYVSQWDNEGGCLVYNISSNGGNWSCELVQTIMVDDLDTDVYGSNLGDWVVDTDANCIYSVKYKIANSSTLEGNALHFCKFKLPKLSDGSSIVFGSSDILDSFTTEMVLVTQDKKIRDGVLFFSAGNTSINNQKICAVSLTRKGIISEINLEGYGNEPEGVAIIDEGLVIGYGFSPTKFYIISDVID